MSSYQPDRAPGRDGASPTRSESEQALRRDLEGCAALMVVVAVAGSFVNTWGRFS